MYHQRGETVCSNRLTIRQNELETRLLQGLQQNVLREETIDYIVGRLACEVKRLVEVSNDELAELKARKRELECEIERLIHAIAMGEESQLFTAAIGGRERDLQSITNKLLEPHPKSIQIKLDELRTFASSRLTDLRGLLSKPHNIHEARASLAEYIGKITLFPDPSSGYIAKGGVDFLGDSELRVNGAEGQNRTAYAGLFRAALYR
jgi:hypothetical protein